MPRQRLDGPDAQYADVRSGIVDLLKTARAISARSINAVMTATYWEIGRRIVESEMRGEKRADYGERLVERLAVDFNRTIRARVRQDQSLADAGLLPGMARETDSFNTVERISRIRVSRSDWPFPSVKRPYPLGHVPTALVRLPAATRGQESGSEEVL
jgi:hypothetical protein